MTHKERAASAVGSLEAVVLGTGKWVLLLRAEDQHQVHQEEARQNIMRAACFDGHLAVF